VRFIPNEKGVFLNFFPLNFFWTKNNEKYFGEPKKICCIWSVIPQEAAPVSVQLAAELVGSESLVSTGQYLQLRGENLQLYGEFHVNSPRLQDEPLYDSSLSLHDSRVSCYDSIV
jgi:hypothetical protein